MQWLSKRQSANSFSQRICFKHVTEISRSNYLPNNRIPQYDTNHKINEPKQLGQTIRAKFCIFIKPSILAFWSSQVYSLSNFLFLCQKGSALPCSRLQKVNQLTVFLDEFALKPWQKVLVQIIYLLNILAYKKYQITIPQYTSNARRHFEFHSSETWRHTGSDDSNVFPWDPLELLASVFFQRDLEFRIGKEFYSRISYFLHSSLEYATFLIACLIEITLLPFLEEKSGPKLRRTKRFH